MEFLQTAVNRFDLFLLVVARMTGIFSFAPFWGSKNTPVQVKIGLSFMFAFIIFPLVAKPQIALPNDFISYFISILIELLVGLIIGYIAMLILMAIQFAGQLIDIQMGLSIVSVFDPQSSTSMPLMGQFKYLIALMVFLALDGHHQLLIALFRSYQAVPLLGLHLTGGFLDYLLYLGQQMFINAFCLSAPILGTLFVVDMVLAIMTKAVPQLNVFVIGFPVKIAIGMVILVLIIPLYVGMLQGIFAQIEEALKIVLLNLH